MAINNVALQQKKYERQMKAEAEKEAKARIKQVNPDEPQESFPVVEEQTDEERAAEIRQIAASVSHMNDPDMKEIAPEPEPEEPERKTSELLTAEAAKRQENLQREYNLIKKRIDEEVAAIKTLRKQAEKEAEREATEAKIKAEEANQRAAEAKAQAANESGDGITYGTGFMITRGDRTYILLDIQLAEYYAGTQWKRVPVKLRNGEIEGLLDLDEAARHLSGVFVID